MSERRSESRQWPGWVWICALAAALASEPVFAQSAWRPERAVEIVVGASPGGGTDLSARVLQKILQEQKLVEAAIVVNKPGGGQTVSWVYMSQHAGDGHYISIVNEPLLTNRIMGVSPLGHGDFTPLAVLFHEHVVFLANSQSAMKSGRELLERMKTDFAAVSFGFGSSRGNNTHIAIALLARATGMDARRSKIVVFKSGGEALTALLGAHIDVGVSTIAPAIQHIQSGRLRPVAVASPGRLSGELAAVPTWREQGADVTYASWRIVFGPKGLTGAQIAFWEKVLGEAVQSADWKADLARNFREGTYAGSVEARRFLDAEYQRLVPLLTDLGLAKMAR